MSLEESFMNVIVMWKALKEEAMKKNDFQEYIWFLKEIQKAFTKLYADLESPEAISLVEEMLKFTTCEIKESIIKYK